jgi:hypothetical protein
MGKTESSFNTISELHYNPAIEDIRRRVYVELNAMAAVLHSSIIEPLFRDISNSCNSLLDDVAFLINTGQIDPFSAIRTSSDEPAAQVTDSPLRIGVYPVTANPFHWAHLLIGLSALTRHKLDKIIYIISGDDPHKPVLVNAEARHRVGKKILNLFAPFYKYSSIALGGNHDGETNIFRLLALNPEQKVDAYYMVGADHYQRSNPVTGVPDTIQKLEDNLRNKIYGFNEEMHHISVIFIKRGTINQSVDSELDISFLPEMPFAASSTVVRDAFQGNQPLDTLALLPYTAMTNADIFQPRKNYLFSWDSKKSDVKSLNPLNFSVSYGV